MVKIVTQIKILSANIWYASTEALFLFLFQTLTVKM